ncbi:MAG: mechanosensitive ion channel family protein [Armatimonadota bacterium]|jgi:MscS family membrane protein
MTMMTTWQPRVLHGLLILSLASSLCVSPLVYFCAPAHAQQQAAAGPEDVAAGPHFDLSSYFPEWARREVVGIAIWQFTGAFVCILAGLVLRRISDFVFEKKLIPALSKTRVAFDNVVATAASKPLGYLLLLGGIASAFAVLPLPREPNVHGFVFAALKVLLAANITWLLFRLVDAGVEELGALAERTESKLDDQLVPLVQKALKVTIGVIAGVWVVQLLGYSVSSLLAGLGIGGLAVALALQDTLGNLFGSVFIFLDRPFAVGDWIKVDDVEGIVEDIGFRSTRIRTWPATQITIPNKTVANATIDNWSRMPKRQVSQTVGVTYETSPEQMAKAVETVREIVENDEGVDKEFTVVRFTDFGESSLNIMVYYYTTAVGWNEHLATKERINLCIMRALCDMGLEIAFPTQTLHFAGDVAEGFARSSGRGIEGSDHKGGGT